MASFEASINGVLEHEGGYVNHPSDPGGETKYGISKKAYPDEDIAGLTLGRAKELYKRDYWQYDAVLDQRIADKVFDMAVNMGPSQAHKLLQKALNGVVAGPVAVDGVFGPSTLSFVNAADQRKLLTEIRARQAEFYCKLVLADVTKLAFLLGWLRRAAH